MTNDIVTTAQPDYRQRARQVFENLDVSPTTRQDYQYRVGMFIDFISAKCFNRNSFLEFKRELASRTDMAVATKNKYLASARIFLKELNRTGLIQTDITQNVKSFVQSKKHKRDGLNDEEMARLTNWLQQLPLTPTNARLKAVISLLALQGLRQIEIIRLDVKDLDLMNKTAFVQGKGEDDKVKIDLHPETVKALQAYVKTNKIADGALFTSQSNNSLRQRLTTRGLRKIIGQVLSNLSVEKTAHGFRHFFTTKLIQTYKGDLLEVAHYTRHKSLEMLQVYNDNIKQKTDLPRFYSAFKEVNF